MNSGPLAGAGAGAEFITGFITGFPGRGRGGAAGQRGSGAAGQRGSGQHFEGPHALIALHIHVRLTCLLLRLRCRSFRLSDSIAHHPRTIVSCLLWCLCVAHTRALLRIARAHVLFLQAEDAEHKTIPQHPAVPRLCPPALSVQARAATAPCVQALRVWPPTVVFRPYDNCLPV